MKKAKTLRDFIAAQPKHLGCFACSSPYRAEIEEAHVEGAGSAVISRGLKAVHVRKVSADAGLAGHDKPAKKKAAKRG